MAVDARPTINSLTIPQLLDEIIAGRYHLPDFQRSLVWDPDQVVELLESMAERTGIGFPLVMSVQTPGFSGATRYLEAQKLLFDTLGLPLPSPGPYDLLIIDGQQRINSIFYAFFCETIADPPSVTIPGSPTSSVRPSISKILSILSCSLGTLSSPPPHPKMSSVFFIVIDVPHDEPKIEAQRVKIRGKKSPLYSSYINKYLTLQEVYDAYLAAGESLTSLPHEIEEALRRKVHWTHSSRASMVPLLASQISKMAEKLLEYIFNMIEQRRVSFGTMVATFDKVNRLGEELTIFDMAVAVFNPHGINLRKELDNWIGGLEKISLNNLLQSVLEELNALHAPGKATGSSGGRKSRGDRREDLIRVMGLITPGVSIKKGAILEDIVKKISHAPIKTIKTIGDCTVSSLTDLWEYAVMAYQAALDRLHERYGVYDISYLPYATMLPALAAFLHAAAGMHHGCHSSLRASPLWSYFDPSHTNPYRNPSINPYLSLPSHVEDMIDCWYWVSVFGERYSGSAITTTETDVSQFKNWLTKPTALPGFCNTSSVELSLRSVKRNEAIHKAVLCLIYRNLKSYSKSPSGDLFGNPIYHLEIDHIFPRRSPRSHSGHPWKGHLLIDNILNLTLVTPSTNKAKDAHPPSHYLLGMMVPVHGSSLPDVLSAHLISSPAGENAMRHDDFDAFLNDREMQIALEVKRLLKPCERCRGGSIKVYIAKAVKGQEELIEVKEEGAESQKEQHTTQE